MNTTCIEWSETHFCNIDMQQLAETIINVYEDYIEYNWNPSDIWEFIESGMYKDYSDDILDELNINYSESPVIENLWESIDEKEFNNIIINLHNARG